MIITTLSDLHGNLIDIETKCDVLCICGDIVPLKIQRNIPKSLKWLKTDFIKWANDLDCSNVLLVAGNHDFVFERIRIDEVKEVFLGTKITYLCDSGCTIDDITFYGTPLCHMFGNWAFMTEPEHQEKMFAQIPDNLDVLLTHDAPYGCTDVCYEATPWNKYAHIGNPELANAILNKNIRYNLHGHLHSSLHDWETLGNTQVRNVAILNESYNVAFEPFTFEVCSLDSQEK